MVRIAALFIAFFLFLNPSGHGSDLSSLPPTTPGLKVLAFRTLTKCSLIVAGARYSFSKGRGDFSEYENTLSRLTPFSDHENEIILEIEKVSRDRQGTMELLSDFRGPRNRLFLHLRGHGFTHYLLRQGFQETVQFWELKRLGDAFSYLQQHGWRVVVFPKSVTHDGSERVRISWARKEIHLVNRPGKGVLILDGALSVYRVALRLQILSQMDVLGLWLRKAIPRESPPNFYRLWVSDANALEELSVFVGRYPFLRVLSAEERREAWFIQEEKDFQKLRHDFIEFLIEREANYMAGLDYKHILANCAELRFSGMWTDRVSLMDSEVDILRKASEHLWSQQPPHVRWHPGLYPKISVTPLSSILAR